MKRLIIILGIIAAVLGLVLSVTPLSQLAYLPALAAFIFGGIAYYISKKNRVSFKTVQMIFLLTIITISLTSYKAIFNEDVIGDIEEFELKEEASIKDSKEILEKLDLEIDESDLDSIEMEEPSINIDIKAQ